MRFRSSHLHWHKFLKSHGTCAQFRRNQWNGEKMKQGWLVGFKFQWIDSRVFFWTHGFHPQSGFVSTFCPILNQIEQFENLKSLRIFIPRRDKNLGVWLRPHTIGGLDFFKIGLVSIRVRSQVFKQFWKQNIFGTKESRNPDVDHFHGKPFEHTQQKQVGCFPFPHWWVHLLGDVFEIWNEQTQQTNIVLSTERSWKYVVRSNNYSIAIFCWSAFQIISACKHWFCFNFPWFKIWHACAEHVHLRKEQNLFPNGAIVLSEPPGKRITNATWRLAASLEIQSKLSWRACFFLLCCKSKSKVGWHMGLQIYLQIICDLHVPASELKLWKVGICWWMATNHIK